MVPISELETRIRRRYDAESGGASNRFSSERIRTFINEGLETLAESTGFYERYVTIPVVAEQTYYDLRGFTPETVVTVSSVWSTDRNDWLKPETVESLDTTWEQAVGDPQIYWMRGVHWIGIHPRSSGTSGYLRIYFNGIPGRLTHPQAVLGDLPNDHTISLEDYALYEMAACDRNAKRALLHWADYAKREKALHDYMDRRLTASKGGSLGRLAGKIS